MIAPLLFILLMGTIEVGLLFFSQFMLQSAVSDAARMIRTGQVAAANMTKDQFRQYVCDHISPLLACNTNLQIDVESFTGFSSLSYTDPLDASQALKSNLNNYSVGSVCSVVLVRGFYSWSVMTPILTPFLVNMANDKHLLSAASAFRNEPYNTSVAGC